MSIKKRMIKELGFLLISSLLVALSYMISGTFFQVWIDDLKILILLVILFYLIIGFYRILNTLARKYRDQSDL